MQTTRVEPAKHLLQSIFKDVTPVRLRLLLVANVVAAMLFCCVALLTVEQHRHAVRTVGLDAAPSVIAAHEIRIGAEKMDADLAGELLQAAGSDEQSQSRQAFDKWRISVCKQLVTAAKNITYGSAEQVPIENIQVSLSDFLMQAQAARDAREGKGQNEAINKYIAAFKILETQLLPYADALNKANADALETTYAEEESQSALACGLVAVVGMLVVALLVAVVGMLVVALLVTTQLYLSKRFRRRLNGPLIVATLILAVFVQHLYLSLRHAGEHLKVAKEDSYNSIVALLDARANVYDAAAAETRWLLDRSNAKTHEDVFAAKVSNIARFADKHSFSDTIAAAQGQSEKLERGERISLPGFSGSLADELANVRFEGEGQAALEGLQAFSDYVAADGKMRQIENAGGQAKAIKLALGYSPDSVKFCLLNFDNALGRMLKINEHHFKLSVGDAFHDLKGLRALIWLVCLGVCVCTYLGLRPRMAEYL